MADTSGGGSADLLGLDAPEAPHTNGNGLIMDYLQKDRYRDSPKRKTAWAYVQIEKRDAETSSPRSNRL